MTEVLISKATQENWKRLNLTDEEIKNKLTSRANKKLSVKKIVPVEYFNNKKNIKKIDSLLSCVSDYQIEQVIFNLGVNLLLKSNLVKIEQGKIVSNNKNILKIIEEYGVYDFDEFLLGYDLPDDETDVLGIIYQSLMSEGNKNIKGSYYTPPKIVDSFLNLIKKDIKVLDMCCGTGGFLLRFADKIENPQNIYGYDLDKTACFILRLNLVLKYKEIEFYPNIFNRDFLEEKPQMKFDLIATNPPWSSGYGDEKYIESFPQIKSKEAFSYFIVQSEKFLSDRGICCLVLPESILNVNMHKDVRKFILKNYHIEQIELYGKAFTKVLTDVIGLKLSRNKDKNIVKITKDNLIKTVDEAVFWENENYKFSLISNYDVELLKKIYSRPYNTLADSTFALGIVTGNNQKHISTDKKGEKIYTGKNITPYFITDTDNYIEYNRKNFQQAAPDEIYRAEEKLLYKFVSKKLVFGYDNQKRLFLNSANILIPMVENYSTLSVLAFLNSKLFQYIYKSKFNELKILKSNLKQLPFPVIDENTEEILSEFSKKYLETKDEKFLKDIDNQIYKIFGLTQKETEYLENNINN